MADNCFLQETRLCNWRQPEIMRLAEQFRDKAAEPRDLAVGIYHFVRDEIQFKNISPDVPASEVLRTKTGNCFGKAKLQISLLRAAGIPAGFELQELSAEKILPFFSKEALEIIGIPVQHIFCMVNLDKRWIRADATFNAELLKRAGLDWEMGKEWNGREDRGLPGEVVLRDLAGPLSISFPPDQEIPHLEPEILEVTNRRVQELWGRRRAV